MAEPLAAKSPGAVALLEESVQVLRAAPFSLLLTHWIGSAPFVLGALVFWNSLTSGPLSDSACALLALMVAALLVWMNCWRAVFAGRLRRQLSGASAVPWTWNRAASLIATQSFLGALKLAILPLAGLVLFPFANAVAFFRTAAALADREDLDPMQLIARSRSLARVHSRQSWGVLPILFLLYLVLAANIALVYVLLPFLIRMLTGYESEFNRGAGFLAQGPLFWVFAFLSAWALFDPFVQAVYCVRCFHAESVATGEDLRVGLRRIRAAKVAAALLLLALVPHASAEIGTSELETASRQAMQAPEYNWRIPPPPTGVAAGRPWVLRAADKVLDVLNSAWSAIGHAIRKVLDWIFGKLIGTNSSEGGAAPGAGLHWSIYAAIGGLAIAVTLIVIRLRASKRKAAPVAAPSASSIRLEEEGVTADQLPEEEWTRLAQQCLRDEKYRLALRAYYLASLAWLGQRDFIAIHAGKTNREYEVELRRRGRQFAGARSLFAANVLAFEAAWYGLHEVSGTGVAEFRERFEGMKKVMA